MKSLSDYLQKKTSIRKKIICDDKTIFFIFTKVIQREYGRRGLCEFTPHFYRFNIIYVNAKRSSWAHELYIHKENIVKKVNDELGGEEVKGLKVDTNL